MRERKLNRLAGFNYAASRYYFFTICVKSNIHSFGTIEYKSIHLSQNGNIVREQWKWLGNQYPYIELISFVIMPDHVHGIIHIDADFYNHNVGNGRDRSLQSIQSKPKIKPLPELIGAYKTTVSKRIHLAGDKMFKWQKSYHEHIIRNGRSLNIIINYIRENPEKWI